MKVATAREMIEVADLRVGMFVHLDMGWMSHPFPLGSFRIANDEQIATIRTLGLTSVRWSRGQSDMTFGAGSLGTARAAGADVFLDESGAVDTAPEPKGPAPTPAEAAAAAEVQARHAHARQLASQRSALQLCERQFAEAAFGCRQAAELVPQQPAEARECAERLAQALTDKMLGAQDICIRLLTTVAGDKAATHALNVTVIAMLMGRTFGLDEAELRDLGVGAMLHDIGKIDLPERVRHREDHFSASEQRFYEEHVGRGVAHARRMGLSPGATLVIAQHHEHADGSGFPLRLNTDRLTAAARVVALVNRYDNLCNPHVAAKALTPHEAVSLLFAQGRTKFDTAILGAFIRMMGVYPAGSTVQLTDDRFAMVVSVNSTRPLKPRVLVHDAGVPREEALVLDLETQANLGIRRSIKPLQLPPASLEYLAPRPRVAYFFEPVDAALAGAPGG